MTWVPVEVQEDHIQGLLKGEPIAGIIQLVWNSIDAEAREINVVVVENGLGAVEEIRVEDDGHGMTHEEATEYFALLGGSWKRRAEKSKNDLRILHGQEGKGRWKAFTLGSKVVWTTVAEHSGTRQLTEITGHRGQPKGFEVSDPVDCEKPIGTIAQVIADQPGPRGLLGEKSSKSLTATFALYLNMYPELEIKYRGSSLDPTPLQQYSADYTINMGNNKYGDATLTIIEWSDQVRVQRGLYLCDANGITLADLKPGIQASGYEFTAYVRWDGFRDMEDRLMLAENDQELSHLITVVRNQMRDHFKQRREQHILNIVEEWKQDQVYPYADEPQSDREHAVRDLFDVVAVKAASAVNSSEDQVAKRLSLRLLKEALETSPTSLRRVLTEVLQLSKESLYELNKLLDRTTFTNIIEASSLISKRLDFLLGLRQLVFDPMSVQYLKERSQLHRILTTETWVFGEEFAVTVDDQNLTNALKAHIKMLGREELASLEPVLDEQGKDRILDLLLARSSPQDRDRHEHLVVELKAPNVTIGADEITQIKRYAYAVAKDSRFNMTDVKWDFIVVSSDLDDFARQEISTELARHNPGLLQASDGGEFRIWIKTWAQIIDTAEHRHKFVKNALKYTPSSDDALAYLREVHNKYLPDSLAAP